MKPLRNRLQEARKRLGLPWEILERDYVLSWLLAGVSHVEALRHTLVFKGGTALKKCFFDHFIVDIVFIIVTFTGYLILLVPAKSNPA